MEVEFMARFPKEFTKEEQKDIDDQAKALMLFDGDLTLQGARNKVLDDGGEESFQYGPWTLDMNDVSDYTMVDKDHTRIFKKNGMTLVLLITYDHFKMVKYMTTSLLPTHFSQYSMPAMEMMPPIKPATKRKKS